METNLAPIETGTTTAARLGYPSGLRLLMINADDFGLCDDANSATIEGLMAGTFTSATIIVPAPGFAEAASFAAANTQIDCGVHLTLNSEWPDWRWGPVLGGLRVPSLVDESGFFHPTVHSLFAYARLEEVAAELNAQIERALDSGIDVTHLDCHMGPLHLRADYHEIYAGLARRYRLPIRIPPRTTMHRLGMTDALTRLDAEGILYPDNFISGVRRTPQTAESCWNRVLDSVPAGISEIYCHPARAGGQISRIARDHAQREADFNFFTLNASRIIESSGIRRINYRALRTAMRMSAAITV